MQISPILWLAAAVGFLALEASTFNMTSIWFAIGSAAALLCCVFTGSFRVQAVVFLVVSILCLAAFRPLAAKLRLKHTATNGDRNLGREAIVLSPVTAEVPGRVRLDGVDWNARCATPGDTLTPGSLCRVTEIHSTLLIVEPVLTESRNPPHNNLTKEMYYGSVFCHPCACFCSGAGHCFQHRHCAAVQGICH